jgi:molybdate transport system substrate-binding protein
MIRCLLALLLLAPVPCRAAEITVLSTGAFQGVAAALVPGFETATGNTVVLRNDTAGGVLRRLASREKFDVVVIASQPGRVLFLSPDSIVAPDTWTTLARVGIGVGARAGTTPPDIGTVDSFKATLLGARKIAMIDPASGGSSGIYLARMFQTMGIAEALAPKLVLINGGLAGTAVADGRADIALQQMSEILAVPGVSLAGPLPPEIQNWTTYAGAIASDTANPDQARAFLATLSAPDVRPLLTAKGLTPP